MARIVVADDDVDVRTLVVLKLESSGHEVVSVENAQGRYYRAMLEAMAARGAASIYRYYFGEQLVAMDLCVEGGGVIVVLQTLVFLLAFVFAPKHGYLAARRRAAEALRDGPLEDAA